jgi:hypothetical protein
VLWLGFNSDDDWYRFVPGMEHSNDCPASSLDDLPVATIVVLPSRLRGQLPHRAVAVDAISKIAGAVKITLRVSDQASPRSCPVRGPMKAV